MVPNLETLNLGSCKQLKKVHYSVGRLKKLKEWYLYDCIKLETLPRSLKMNSLTQFSLKGCSRLKKLPKFSQEMKSLFSFELDGSGIRKLPPSLENLIGLQTLSLGNDLKKLLVPSFIYKLQFIRYLELKGDVIFSKEVKIDRQPLCQCYEGLPNVFPNLKSLDLNNFKSRRELKFILISCCPLSLKSLSFSDMNGVTLPNSIKRFERLHELCIENCKELQEIPRLPQSIREVRVLNCDSLDSSSSSKISLKVSFLSLSHKVI
jgi:Leucine-rich repeat (LRR) protein